MSAGFGREISIDSIPDGGALELWLDADDEASSVVVLRQDRQVFAYRNICPHAGRSLNLAPGRFILDTAYLLCAVHGAVFQINDGLCVGGPCRGASLSALTVTPLDPDHVRISA